MNMLNVIIDLATSECALAVKAVHEHIHIKKQNNRYRRFPRKRQWIL